MVVATSAASEQIVLPPPVTVAPLASGAAIKLSEGQVWARLGESVI